MTAIGGFPGQKGPFSSLSPLPAEMPSLRDSHKSAMDRESQGLATVETNKDLEAIKLI